MDQNEIESTLAQIEDYARKERSSTVSDLAKGLKDGLSGLANLAELAKGEYGDMGKDMPPMKGEEEDEEEAAEELAEAAAALQGDDRDADTTDQVPNTRPGQSRMDDDEGPGPGSFDMGKGDGEFLDITDVVLRLEKSVKDTRRLAAALAKQNLSLHRKLDALLQSQPVLAKGIQGLDERMNTTEAPSRGHRAFRSRGRAEAEKLRKGTGLTEGDVYDAMLKGVIEDHQSSLWARTGRFHADDATNERIVKQIKAAAQS